MRRVLAVINQKGGVGKTTTAINLAAELANGRRRVLLVDLDIQGNATSGLGLNHWEHEPTLGDLLAHPGDINKTIVRLTNVGIDLLPGGGQSLIAFEQFAASQPQPEQILKALITPIGYDYVILDCPPSLGLMTINALAAATDLIIPVQAEYYALEGLGQLLSLVNRVKDTVNTKLNILGVVVTIFDKRTTLAKDVKAQLIKSFGDKVFKTVIPRNVRLAEAPSHGVPVRIFDNWSKGARAYKALTREVLGKL